MQGSQYTEEECFRKLINFFRCRSHWTQSIHNFNFYHQLVRSRKVTRQQKNQRAILLIICEHMWYNCKISNSRQIGVKRIDVGTDKGNFTILIVCRICLSEPFLCQIYVPWMTRVALKCASASIGHRFVGELSVINSPTYHPTMRINPSLSFLSVLWHAFETFSHYYSRTTPKSVKKGVLKNNFYVGKWVEEAPKYGNHPGLSPDVIMNQTLLVFIYLFFFYLVCNFSQHETE